MTENENIFHSKIHRGLTVYFARIIPNVNIYEVKDLFVRTVAEDYFVATDKKDKHAFLFMYKDIDEKDNNIFYDRKDAVKKVKEAEKNIMKSIDKGANYDWNNYIFNRSILWKYRNNYNHVIMFN